MNQEFLPPLNSQTGLRIRAHQEPESVSVFSDSELFILEKLLRGIRGDAASCLLGELMVRRWLYQGSSRIIDEAMENLIAWFGAEDIQQQFAQRFSEARKNPVRLTEQEFGDLVFHHSDSPWRVCWEYACRRLKEFLNCHGIIPAVVNTAYLNLHGALENAHGEAIAIPFTIDERNRGLFKDWSGSELTGWIGEASELWAAMGVRRGVLVGCNFGHYHRWKGQTLVQGASFGLPVLLAICQRAFSAAHPLEVLCTGRVADGKLAAVNGISAKGRLAEKMGARLFVSSGIRADHTAASDTQYLSLPSGLSCGMALKQIFSDLQPGASCDGIISALFSPRKHAFDHVLAASANCCVGRDAHLEEMLDHLLAVPSSSARSVTIVHGEPGCGKSVFMANLIARCRTRHDLQPAIFFFGKSNNKRDPDVVASLASQLADSVGFDWPSVINDNALDQFRAVIKHASLTGGEHHAFIVDGLDEADEHNLDMLTTVMTESSRCIWIVSARGHFVERLRRELGELNIVNLPRLDLAILKEHLADVAPEMNQQLRDAIIHKSEGLPLYMSTLHELWRGGMALTSSNLPGLEDFYAVVLKHLERPTFGDRSWRHLIVPTLVLLATARNKVMLSEATLVCLLRRMGVHGDIGLVKKALQASIAVAMPGEYDSVDEEDGEGRYWGLRHDLFRRFLVTNAELARELGDAVSALKDVCLEWTNARLSPGEKAYAARFLINELLEANDLSEIIRLAHTQEFFDFQKNNLSTEWALRTIAKGIELAFDERRLADVCLLSLRRADCIKSEYCERPIEVLSRGDERLAVETISRIENQDDRTLWHLTLAAHHALEERHQDAARILDDHIPKDALRERLPVGKSFCAAALLCILVDVPAISFPWEWFLSRLSDESKEFAARTLMRIDRVRAARSMIGAIKNSTHRDSARRSAVKYLAEVDIQSAKRELVLFRSDSQRQWAMQELVAAYANRGNWPAALRMLAGIQMPRQRAKALGSLSAEYLTQGNKEEGTQRFKQAKDVLRRSAGTAPENQILGWAELAMSQAEHGFLERAERAFEHAFELVDAAPRIPKVKFTKKRQASAYVGITACLAPISKRFTSFRPLMRQAISSALKALAGTGQMAARDETRLRLLRHLGRWNYTDLAKALLPDFEQEDARNRARGILSALMLRYNPHDSDVAKLQRNARDSDARHEIAGVPALELVVTRPREVVTTISRALFLPKESHAWRWGKSRLVTEVGLATAKWGSADESLLIKARDGIIRNLRANRCAWHLVDLASSALAGGYTRIGSETIQLALDDKYLPHSEEQQVMISAAVEVLQIQHGLRSAIALSVDGVFPKVWQNRNYNLMHGFMLMRRLIVPLAQCQRLSELEQICEFIYERVDTERFELSKEDRNDAAGETAAQLVIAASHIPSLDSWVDRFCGVCRTLERNSDDDLRIPDSAERAMAVKRARTELKEGIRLATKISDGGEQSKALRDIALDAIGRGEYPRIKEVCSEMINDRSEHLADIFIRLAQSMQPDDKRATALMRTLLLSCSDYTDAVYRTSAALLRTFTPISQDAQTILAAMK